MRHDLPRPWLAVGLLVALVSGCEHAGRPTSGPPLPVPRDDALPSQAALGGPDDLPGGEAPASYHLRPAEDGAITVPVPPARVRTGQARHRRPCLPPAERTVVAALEWTALSAPVGPPVACLERPSGARTADLPAVFSGCPSLAHAGDHRWLVGFLLHDPAHDRWSVRYASPGEPDLYGGYLQLVNTGPMDGFNVGRLVRVEGELVDPAPLEIKPAFRVRSIQLLRP